jgi:hypothetical protein
VVQVESGAAMVNVTVATGTVLATSNLRSNDKTKTTPSDARNNDSAANRNTNATALRMIIDSPLYISFITDLPFG